MSDTLGVLGVVDELTGAWAPRIKNAIAGSYGADYSRWYAVLLASLLDSEESLNQRTGAGVRTLRGGTSVRIDPRGYLPVCGVRKLRPRTAAAEVAWFVSGSNRVEDLQALGCRIWDKFASADGTMPGAYGYRWRWAFGRDQLKLAVRVLTDNPSDRQVVVSAWDPAGDGLGQSKIPNVPCPTHFALSLQGEELHMSAFLRSSDAFVGLPYDIMGHAMLASVLANTLGVRVGVIHLTLANVHLYESHYDMALEAIKREPRPCAIPLQRSTMDDVEKFPKQWVKKWERAQGVVEWPEYDPKPEVIL